MAQGKRFSVPSLRPEVRGICPEVPPPGMEQTALMPKSGAREYEPGRGMEEPGTGIYYPGHGDGRAEHCRAEFTMGIEEQGTGTEAPGGGIEETLRGMGSIGPGDRRARQRNRRIRQGDRRTGHRNRVLIHRTYANKRLSKIYYATMTQRHQVSPRFISVSL